MSVFLLLLFWVAFTVVFAMGQGLLMPAIRRTPPGQEADKQSFALHWLFGVVWALPLLPWFLVLPVWTTLAMPILIRLSLFDPFLNLAEGNLIFAVGGSAGLDKILHKIAGVFGTSAPVLSAVLRGLSFLLLAVMMWLKC